MAVLFGERPCVDPAALYRACLDATPPLPTDWAGQANRFAVPLGRGPGAGAVILTRADLDALDLDADHTLSFRDDRTPNRPIDLRRITLLRSRCLTPGHRDDARAVYLCELVDRRHFLAQVPCDAAYNVRDADGTDYLGATTNGGDPWTWAEVVEDLWDLLDAGDVPDLPFTPDGTPENLRYHAGWAWEAINDVLDRIACAVRYDAVEDAFTFVRLGDTAAAGATALTAALATHDRAGRRTWDAYHDEPDRGRLPETVRVLFPRRPVPTDGASPWYAEDVTLTATAGVEPGTVVQLHDDLTAVGTGTPTNAAALTTRAEERAADWRRKRLGYERRLTLVYRDFRPDLTAGELAERAALDDHGGPMVTVVESAPDGRLERWRPWVPPLGSDAADDPGAGGDCGSCAWLSDLGAEDAELPPPKLKLYLRGGSGRCSCIPTDDTEDAAAGAVMEYDATDEVWRSYTEIPLCCGCAYAVFAKTGSLTASLTLNQFVSCLPGEGECGGGGSEGSGSGSGSGGSGAMPVLATISLVQECCGVDSEGRPYVSFFGRGQDPCDADPSRCDNTFRVRVVCDDSPCDVGKTTCGTCLEGEGPGGWLVVAEGFADCCVPYTGRWFAEPVEGEPCTWQATCEESGVTVEVVVTCDKATVTFSGAAGCGDAVFTTAGGGVGFLCFTNHDGLTSTDPAMALVTVDLEPVTCLTPCPVGLTVSSSGALPCSTCDGSSPTTWTDEPMSAFSAGYLSATLGGGLLTADCECDGVVGSGSCKGFGVVVRCNEDDTFDVGPYCGNSVGCEELIACYAGPAETVTVANEATLPDVLFSVTFEVDDSACGGATEVTLTFTNMV